MTDHPTISELWTRLLDGSATPAEAQLLEQAISQDETLRRKFKGQPEHVVNYFFMVAEELRAIMANIGVKRVCDMIGLLQRVSEASVTVESEVVGAIERGLLVLVGVQRDDGPAQASRLAERLLAYRVFPDEQGRMNGLMWGSKLIGRGVGAWALSHVLVLGGLEACVAVQIVLLGL